MAEECLQPCEESCVATNPSGNLVSQIPVKVGTPLSSACERAVTDGSIPQIVRFANWTQVNGAPVQNRVSMGGICSIPSFFKTRNGCFYSSKGRLSGATCC